MSLLVANLFGIPQSTSQSTVLSFAAVAIYFEKLNSEKLMFEIIPAWLILSAISFVISLLIGKYIYRPMRRRGLTLPRAQNANMMPVWNGLLIVLFGKFEAVIIAFVSGSLLLFASLSKGIPTSLVQLNVAAILGIGVAKLGYRHIFKKNAGSSILPDVAYLTDNCFLFVAFADISGR